MGDDQDEQIAALRRQVEDRDGLILTQRRELGELREELKGYAESYNRAAVALSAAGVPCIVPNASTDEDERLAERVRFLASMHPLFVWPHDAEAMGKLAKVKHLLSDHRRALEALMRMAANRVDINGRESRELVVRLTKAELERIKMFEDRESMRVVIGVDMAKPGTEETVVLVRVCGCGKNPACPEGPTCTSGFHIARRVRR